MRIAIYSRVFKSVHEDFFRELFGLLSELDIDYCIFDKYYDEISQRIEISEKPETFSNHKELRGHVDYMVSIGGDGTLLDTVHYVRDSRIWRIKTDNRQ